MAMDAPDRLRRDLEVARATLVVVPLEKSIRTRRSEERILDMTDLVRSQIAWPR